MIRFNYMSHPDDWSEFRHCIRLTREIFGQKAFDPYRGREIPPGASVQSDDEIDALHPRTCRKRLPSLRHLPHGPRRRSDWPSSIRNAG